MPPKPTKSIFYYCDHPRLVQGYNDRVLRIDLGKMSIRIDPVPPETRKLFIGGKGYCLKELADSVNSTTKWDDPENALVFSPGPLAGTPACGSGKAIAMSLTPLSVQKNGKGDKPYDSNFGGGWGTLLKHAGFDALTVTGLSDQPVIIVIDQVRSFIDILPAEDDLPDDAYQLSRILTERHAGKKKSGKKDYTGVSVLTTGIGAKNTLMGCINASYWSRGAINLKQAGRGVGTVMARKNIKAIVVRCARVKFEDNNFTDPDGFKEVARKQASDNNRMDPLQNRMQAVGTAHIPFHVNANNCIPVRNFQFGSDSRVAGVCEGPYEELFERGLSACCKGCTVACAHNIAGLKLKTGPDKGKTVRVNGPEYETIAAFGPNLGIFNPRIIAEANYYCDKYGLDTISTGVAIAFVTECFERGFLKREHTDNLKLTFGNWQGMLALLHRIASGRGFGSVVGQGVERMKSILPEICGLDEWRTEFLRKIGMVSKGIEASLYFISESLAQQLGYGLALKGFHHDEAWLIFLDRVKNLLPTFEDKAEALARFPFLRTWFGLYGLCKLPWNDIVPEGNDRTKEPAMVIEHVRWYAGYVTAAFGRDTTPDDLLKQSERVYQFQRMLCGWLGHGSIEDDVVPARALGPVTIEEYEANGDYWDEILQKEAGMCAKSMETAQKITAYQGFAADRYAQARQTVYRRRGWDDEGRVTPEKAEELGLKRYHQIFYG